MGEHGHAVNARQLLYRVGCELQDFGATTSSATKSHCPHQGCFHRLESVHQQVQPRLVSQAQAHARHPQTTYCQIMLSARFPAVVRPIAPALSGVRGSVVPRTTTALRLFHASSQNRQVDLPTYLVTPNQFAHALVDSRSASDGHRLVPLSAAWFLPNDPDGRTGLSSFKQRRIAQSRFFDIDGIKDADSPYPHMLPKPAAFAKAMGELGIRNSDTVIVYDTKELGIISAPRVAWTLRIFGHKRVHVLNNFRLWCEEGHPTVSGEPEQFEPEEYDVPHVTDVPPEVATFDYMRGVVLQGGRQLPSHAVTVDARPHGRWAGLEPEPRPNLESGHMPGSTSVPYAEFLDPIDKTILPAARLKGVFKANGIEPSGPLVTTCGTGITAAIVDLAAGEAAGTHGARQAQHSRKIYDGSWTEWAHRVAGDPAMIKKADAKHQRFLSTHHFQTADT